MRFTFYFRAAWKTQILLLVKKIYARIITVYSHNGNGCTLQQTDGKWCPNMVVATRKGRQECPFPDIDHGRRVNHDDYVYTT